MSSGLFHIAYTTARKLTVAVVGVSVLAIGLALIVLPGPAFVVIPAGIAILAIEFTWARRWLRVIRERSEQILHGNKPSSSNKEQE